MSTGFVAKQGWRSLYSGGNRKTAVAVLVLRLGGSSHDGQGYGEIIGWTKLASLSTLWPQPPTHVPNLLSLLRELATCSVDTEVIEGVMKKEAIDRIIGRECTGSLVSKSMFIS